MSAIVAGPAPPEIDYEARLKELEAHPLFMRDLPDDVHANERLEALQSLIYDDTPDSVYHFVFSFNAFVGFCLTLSCMH